MRLYSDLADGSGRRYYFGLATAPGGITNAEPARLSLFGNLATIQEQSTVFRTPATAALTLFGYVPQAEPRLQPATAALGYLGQIAGLLTIRVITNALPPDYSTLPDNAPTILFIQTITPSPAALTIQSLVHNITQGGNILVISVGKATLTMNGLVANFPRFADVGTLTINGLAATLSTEIRVFPTAGIVTMQGHEPLLSLPFRWTDDDPATAPNWVDDPRA